MSVLFVATPVLGAWTKTTGSGGIEPIQGADTFCVARPITWSSRDTDETMREVKEHHAVWTRLCRGPAVAIRFVLASSE